MHYQAFCELLFGLLHITGRIAIGMYGATEKVSRMLTPLAPLVAAAHVESYFGKVPADQREKIEAAFLLGLGNAQKDYAKCKALVIEGKPYSREAVTGLLVSRVIAIAGDPNDLADLLVAESVTTIAVARMNLRQLIKEASPAP
jgi:hypothetical protein